VRRSDTSKQRVRLGAGQYRDGCRNAATNAAATNAYAYSDGDAVRAWNTYAHSDCNSNGNGNSDSNSNGNGNGNGYSNGYPYGYTYDDSFTVAYSDANDHTDAQGNTKASADSASSADSVVGLGASLECCSRLAMPAAP